MNLSPSKSEVMDDKTVIIKPVAYYKMLVHILRFGNKARDRNTFKEAMGMLIGCLEGEGEIKNVIIEDAIPITHGGSIEVRFSDEQLGAFGEIDMEIWEKYGDRNWFTVGWYHSHPGLRCFFSRTDIFNQLFWQGKNPSGIGIVFDHEYLETQGDYGFRTFRLDDPSKDLMADYHEVKTIVEPPDSLDFYLTLMELINMVHSREPPILEINETPDLFGVIPIPNPLQMFKKQPKLETNEFLSALHGGLFILLELSFKPLIEFLNNWSKEIYKKNIENCVNTKKTLLSLKNNLSNEIINTQKLFKDTLNDKLNNLDIFIDDRLDEFDGIIDHVGTTINELKRELLLKATKLFEEEIGDSISRFLNSLSEELNLIHEFNQKLSGNADNLKNQQSFLGSLMEDIKTSESKALEKLKDIQEKSNAIFKTSLDNIIKIIDDLNEKTVSLKNGFSSIISEFKVSKQKLQEKINFLETEKQDLESKINQSNSEKEKLQAQLREAEINKEELLNKLKNFESGGN